MYKKILAFALTLLMLFSSVNALSEDLEVISFDSEEQEIIVIMDEEFQVLDEPALTELPEPEPAPAEEELELVEIELIEEEKNPVFLVVEKTTPPPKTITRYSKLDYNDYVVKVTFNTSSGIPEDAMLVAKCVLDERYYLNRMLSTEEQEGLEEFYIFSISLISNGIDYANYGGYEVEIVMGEDLPSGLEVISYQNNTPVKLQFETYVDGNQVNRLKFNAI